MPITRRCSCISPSLGSLIGYIYDVMVHFHAFWIALSLVTDPAHTILGRLSLQFTIFCDAAIDPSLCGETPSVPKARIAVETEIRAPEASARLVPILRSRNAMRTHARVVIGEYETNYRYGCANYCSLNTIVS